MILFVFEGERREPMIYEALQRLYLGENVAGRIVCSYNNNIYSLYKEMQVYGEGADVVTLMRQVTQKRGETTLDGYASSSDFAEVFLFFDYDFQHKNLPLDDVNAQLKEMLEYFNEETENGKLYINYPMVEAIRYTKELPDANYYTYEVSRDDSHRFKELVQQFSSYGSLDFITIDRRKVQTEEVMNKLKRNWQYLTDQNVKKANYICHEANVYPGNKDEIAQLKIFDAQVTKYVSKPDCVVAILSAFPLFVYDYVK